MSKDETMIPAGLVERVLKLMPELEGRPMVFEARAGCNTDALRIGNEFIALFACDPTQFSPDRTLGVCDVIRGGITLPLPSAEARTEGLVICPRLAGAPLQRHVLNGLPDEEQDRVADQLGEFLEEFQATPIGTLAHLSLPDRRGALRRSTIEETVQRFVERVGPHLMRPAAAWIQEHCEAFFDSDLEDELAPCLSHGELVVPHIFFDETSRRITGIIDFDQCGLGDPADDLFWLLWSYGQGFLDRIVRARPSLAKRHRRARFLAGFQLMRWMLMGVENNSPAWYATHLSFPFDFVPLRRGE